MNTAAVKNTTLELTINPGYVRGWGVWEALRELVQNALDADDQGHRMTLTRGGGASKTIRICNEGTTLPRSTLLLGGTTKADDLSQRGKFGEGYKLAFLVLCRLGVKVQVRTASEMWTPFIEESDTYGAELLKVKVAAQPKHVESIEVQVHGISDEDWEAIEQRLLNVRGVPASTLASEDFIEVGQAKILTGERFRGQLFARGLSVCKLPDDYTYGYDLPAVQLDRDRKMADAWSLRWEIKNVLGQALASKKLDGERMLELFGEDCGEAQAMAAYYEHGYADELSKGVAEAFHARFGEEAVAVSAMSESMDAAHHGLKGTMVSKAIKFLVEKHDGKFETRKQNRDLDAAKLYGFADLDLLEQANLTWAAGLVAKVEPIFSLDKLQVVDFYGELIEGTFGPTSGVRLAKRLLADRGKTIATLVHEVAHAIGGSDGTVEHRHNNDDLFARIILLLSSN